MATLVHPTRKQVLEAFHQYLQDSPLLTGATSKELATSKGWALMDVSATLNEAADRRKLIRDGAGFRPAVGSDPPVPATRKLAAIGAELIPQAIAETGRVTGETVKRKRNTKRPTHDFPPDPEFRVRYEQAIMRPGNMLDNLASEFGCHYGTVRKQAILVYDRLMLPKPNHRGRRAIKALPVENQGPAIATEPDKKVSIPREIAHANTIAATVRLSASDLELFFANGEDPQQPRKVAFEDLSGSPGQLIDNLLGRYKIWDHNEIVTADMFNRAVSEPLQQSQESPSDQDGPEVAASPSVAPDELEGASVTVLSEEADEAGGFVEDEFTLSLRDRIDSLSFALEDKNAENARLVEETVEILFKVDELSAENAELARRLADRTRLLDDAVSIMGRLEESRKAKDADNAALRAKAEGLEGAIQQDSAASWVKLRQAHDDLTERDKTIADLRHLVSVNAECVDTAQSENARLIERLETCHRTIENLHAQIAQAEIKPQRPITVTLTIGVS